MKSVTIRFVLFLIISIHSVATVKAQDSAATLHILYTQNNNGKLENCQCPSNPLGGFEKRSTFFKNWTSQYPNTIIFDSGDFLSFDGMSDTDLKVIKLMSGLGYTAVNLGDQEFSNGLLFFDAYLLSGNLPLISSNLMLDGEQKPGYKRYVTINVEGIQIAVTGVLSPENVKYYTKSENNSHIWTIAPEKALQIVHNHESAVKEADLHILLSNLGLDWDKKLVDELSFIDLIIGGHSQHSFEKAINKNGTLIVQRGKDGHNIGHLTITVQHGRIIQHKHELIPMGPEIDDDETILKMIQEM